MVKAYPGELHAKPARPATLLEFLFANILPILITIKLYISGFPGALFEQLRHPSPINLINPFHWKSLIFSHGFPVVLRTSDEMYVNMKRPLLRSAYGRVLEVGAGAGDSVGHYDASKIERLFCMEPYAPLRAQLVSKLERVGLAKKSTVVPVGLDKTSRPALLQAGIEPESLDTIVLFQVLCSIPDPKSHLEFLQGLLKKGGQIILFEHVGSKHTLARIIQTLWTPVWSFNFGGCQLNRDSGEWLKGLGGWKEVDLQRPVHETSADLVPHAVGRLVKA
ncbi:hypothetical protein PSEUBRA_000747 [Kalmanozyma brasiliensis GHG001]|uniref:Phospholipid methyltransferase n=1 Tax=Kalmanozyma brasiliensis (strain GHG001) TaxID=1365824 RepID=V5GUI1_KALBG|nr:uncharacterized protein PSEUBRA_000747 [Kalmanozyma brasiliensis GHG001]EST09532.1 hypothetical protein PSEUBRA_000747 [Kalmanozyma brasiliensis GHG001]